VALSDRPRLLVLRALGLGDLLAGVPALRVLRRTFSDHHIQLLAPAVLSDLARASGAVDEVVDHRGLAAAPSQVGGAAVAVNLHGRGPDSHHLLLRTGPRRLLGFRCEAAGYATGPAWRPDEHEVLRWCRMLAGHGLSTDPERDATALDLPRPLPRDPAGPVVIHAGASSQDRCWPADRYGAVARALTAAGHRVLFTGSRAEAPRARAAADAAGLPRTAVLAGATTIADLTALVASARLIVCGDTGVAHLATAYRTPSVVLYGPVDPARWGPPADRRGDHIALWHPTGAPVDRGGPTHPSLLAITVDEVLEAANRLIGTAPLPGLTSVS